MYKSPEMRDAINTNPKIRVGSVINEGPSYPGSSTDKVTYAPGPCLISFFPSFGAMATSSASDVPTNALDDAIQHLYDKVFLGIRNRRLYSPSQFGLALKQFSSYVILHAWLRRVHSIICNKFPNNGYYPKGYLQLEALDASVALEQDKVRELLNTIGNRINSLNIPDLPVYRHQYDMVLNVWTDDKQFEGQQFVFSPVALQKFFEDSSGVQDILTNEYMPAGLWDFLASGAGFTINDIVNAYNTMDDQFNKVQWLSSYVSADLANAMNRKDNAFKKFTVPMITGPEPVHLITDNDELEKISNATLIGTPLIAAGWLTGIVAGDLYEKHYATPVVVGNIRFNTFGGRVLSTEKGQLRDDLACWMVETEDVPLLSTGYAWSFDHVGTEILIKARVLCTVGGRSASNPASWKVFYDFSLNEYKLASTSMNVAEWPERITLLKALNYFPEVRFFSINTTASPNYVDYSFEPRELSSLGVIAVRQARTYFNALNQTAYDSTFAEVKSYPARKDSSKNDKDKNYRKGNKDWNKKKDANNDETSEQK